MVKKYTKENEEYTKEEQKYIRERRSAQTPSICYNVLYPTDKRIKNCRESTVEYDKSCMKNKNCTTNHSKMLVRCLALFREWQSRKCKGEITEERLNIIRMEVKQCIEEYNRFHQECVKRKCKRKYLSIYNMLSTLENRCGFSKPILEKGEREAKEYYSRLITKPDVDYDQLKREEINKRYTERQKILARIFSKYYTPEQITRLNRSISDLDINPYPRVESEYKEAETRIQNDPILVRKKFLQRLKEEQW